MVGTDKRRTQRRPVAADAGTEAGEAVVPDRWTRGITDDDAMACFKEWEEAGGPVRGVGGRTAAALPPAGLVDLIAAFPSGDRHDLAANFVLGLDPDAETPPVSSEPEVVDLDDEVAELPMAGARRVRACRRRWRTCRQERSSARWCTRCWRRPIRSPRIWPPSWRHRYGEHAAWWPVDVDASELAAAMVPMHDTPLGPLADGVTLRQIGLRDRMRELDFEFPLAGGDLRAAAPDIRLADVGELLRTHLPKDDPLAPTPTG